MEVIVLGSGSPRTDPTIQLANFRADKIDRIMMANGFPVVGAKRT